MRLSANWLVRNIALGFIELVRNTPQLVQIIFWYVAVLQTLPGPRQSIPLPGGVAAECPRHSICQASSAMTWRRRAVAAGAASLLLAMPFVWRLPWRGLPLGAKSLLLLPAGSRAVRCRHRPPRLARVARLQHRRRRAGGAGTGRALGRPDDLRRRLHRRDRARRDPVGAQGPARGGPQPRAEAAPGAVARSSCRRRCA